MDTLPDSADRLDALDPDLVRDERAAAAAGWRLLTVELPAGANLPVILLRVAEAAEDCAGEFQVAWSVPDTVGRAGTYPIILGITGEDEVDAAERASWLEDELGALGPEWVITPGVVD